MDTTEETAASNTNVPQPKEAENVPDSWDAADSEAITPDGDVDEDADGEEIVVRTKKKPIAKEETKSKKEHVNVVFIGHVGTCARFIEVVNPFCQELKYLKVIMYI